MVSANVVAFSLLFLALNESSSFAAFSRTPPLRGNPLPTSVMMKIANHDDISEFVTDTPISTTDVRSFVDSRRAFFGMSSAALVGLVLPPVVSPASAAETSTSALDYNAVARDIAQLIDDTRGQLPPQAGKMIGPVLVRLSWHSSGTYSKFIKTPPPPIGGSSKGTIRFKEELDHAENAGLEQTAVALLEPIHKKYAEKGLSYADLYTLAGVTAIQKLGGPSIPWGYGRVDSMDPEKDVPPEGRLPSADSGDPGADRADAAHLRKIFGRMGFSDREIVLLSGAHALGRCHPAFSGYEGPWSFTEDVFDNSYYLLLQFNKWVPRKWEGPLQYEAIGTNGRIMMLPSDLVLKQDFFFRFWVWYYATRGNRIFFEDFSAAYGKLLALGTSGLTPFEVEV